MYEYERYHRRPDPRDKPPKFFTEPNNPQSSTVQMDVPESTHPVRLLSARIYPNGEFGVGFIPRPKKRAADKKYDRGEYENYSLQTEIHNQYDLIEDSTDVLYTKREVQVLRPKLGIGSELSQTTQKQGSKGITAHGRKMLRNAGTIIDLICKGKRHHLPQMGTLTIPSLEKDAMIAIAKNWAYIQKRFFEKCKRRYARLGKRFYYASCSEIQPGRWIERREIGLHIHFLFISYRLSANKWSLPDQWVRNEWKSTLESVVGKGIITGNLNYRRETVRSSSAAYLAKYASKGTEFIREVSEEYGTDVLPSRWWSMSSPLRKCILKHIQTSQSVGAEVLLELCKTEDRRFIKYVREAVLVSEPPNFIPGISPLRIDLLGFGGMLNSNGCALFQPSDMAESIKKHLPHTLDKKRRAS